MSVRALRVPGVYHRPRPRQTPEPRARTDVAGFVGVAGAAHLHEAVAIDDWRSYEAKFLTDDDGAPVDAPAGSRLADTVRAYFANGGARCWVVNVAERVEDPDSPDEPAPRQNELLALLLGLVPPTGIPKVDGKPLRAWGLELLLTQPEVAFVVVPELFCVRSVATPRVATDLPARFEEGEFGACARIRQARALSEAPEPVVTESPFFTTEQILSAQRVLLERIDREKTRVFLLLSPPAGCSPDDVVAWRDALGDWDSAALYWPWVITQDVPGAETRTESPLGCVAGVYARRDLARGPQVAPANERVEAIVGLETPVNDRVQEAVYPRGVNVLRAQPGRGIQVWGARTLLFTSVDDSTTEPLAYVNVRRGLTALERMCAVIGEANAFEPNTPLLWIRLTQMLTGYLQSAFEKGVLQGRSPGEAFFVRCDAALNPPEQIDAGKVVCEVGVAIAVPAEFIVFRLGRTEGVVEIEEA